MRVEGVGRGTVLGEREAAAAGSERRTRKGEEGLRAGCQQGGTASCGPGTSSAGGGEADPSFSA